MCHIVQFIRDFLYRYVTANCRFWQKHMDIPIGVSFKSLITIINNVLMHYQSGFFFFSEFRTFMY